MTGRFDIAAIIGVGLLGGSLGLALKARRMVSTVRGIGHRQSSLNKARETGAVDAVYLDVQSAVRDADLIVICTPAATVPRMLDEVRSACSPAAIVTDVASTKARICRHAESTWPRPRRFVGSHPMAGSEKFGPENAFAGLYNGCVTIVEKNEHLDPEARLAVRNLWEGVGATVIEIAPDHHDRLIARTSHVPHIVAAAIAALAVRARGTTPGEVRPLVGKGFRDLTRIAASRPEVWRDICLTNQESILECLDELIDELSEVRQVVRENRGELLEEFFRRARDARHEVLGE